MQEPGGEVKIITSYPDPAIDEMQISTVDPMTGQPVMTPPAMIHDVQIKRITKDGRIRIMAVPPEELLLDRRARSFDDSTIIAHRQMATMADLLAMGYDQDEIEENMSSTDLDSNDEYLARQPLSTTFGTNDAANPMMRRVLYIEAYSRVDFDNDGWIDIFVGNDTTANFLFKNLGNRTAPAEGPTCPPSAAGQPVTAPAASCPRRRLS